MTKIGSQMMVQRFSEIFSDRPGDTNLAEYRIDLTSDVPVHHTPYPVPFALKSSLKKELQQMKDPGIIRKSDSPYASPVVGSNRICIDFRRLNKITKTDPQPVPSPAVFPWYERRQFFKLKRKSEKLNYKLKKDGGYEEMSWQRYKHRQVNKCCSLASHSSFSRCEGVVVRRGLVDNRKVLCLCQDRQYSTAGG
ncbi:hypothetical protein RRG08_052728 [Elysia crispata]|uniref:Uncharacterized protein n=1 Tax=Elysia crispata TaxID=231223 RepID=A0AAE1EAY6_9GAST|nr:hypothetical protein RRG08_052728 [Elysia crispata]